MAPVMSPPTRPGPLPPRIPFHMLIPSTTTTTTTVPSLRSFLSHDPPPPRPPRHHCAPVHSHHNHNASSHPPSASSCSLLLTAAPASATPEQDAYALSRLKASSYRPPPTPPPPPPRCPTGTLTATPPAHCAFTGVTCDAATSRVVAINLTAVPLHGGARPPEVALLDALASLTPSPPARPFPSPPSASTSIPYFPALELRRRLQQQPVGPAPAAGARTRAPSATSTSAGNYFNGSIPDSFGDLAALEYLGLNGNALSGRVPPSLSASRACPQSLDLSINDLSGEIPATFAGLTNLTLLNLFRNHLRGEIPEFVGEFPFLEVLQVWDNNLTGSLPPALGRNGRLKTLDVTGNHLTGTIPTDLCAGRNLQLLVLMDNAFFGSIPDSLGDCKTLTRVRLGKNLLTGPVPAGLFDLPQANMLELTDNLLTGQLPDVVAGDKIGMLMLGNNGIGGRIPTAIGNLPALQTLSLESNNFSGPLPPEISRLRNLTRLNASGNALTGGIPRELMGCGSSAPSTSAGTASPGEIPDTVTSLKILCTLNVSRNRLSGELPPAMSNMTSLHDAGRVLQPAVGPRADAGPVPGVQRELVRRQPGLCGAPFAGGARALLPPAARVRCSLCVRGTRRSCWYCCSSSPHPPGPGHPGARMAREAWREAARRRSGAWKMTVFQKLDFSADDVVECLKEDNIIGKGRRGDRVPRHDPRRRRAGDKAARGEREYMCMDVARLDLLGTVNSDHDLFKFRTLLTRKLQLLQTDVLQAV
ncbi:unnamed protein product [Miscanthus lutarioriparius]|uniref:Leucine-rich repeat-containing N-terminal plant-type domain-containing protein n=1 Tax=Miscanthus lutarioriparius TaxID=422564 RepID=A0A811S9P2_9POAL|nr:unnamed protein product [Miscanthus lutarioriparius]